MRAAAIVVALLASACSSALVRDGADRAGAAEVQAQELSPAPVPTDTPEPTSTATPDPTPEPTATPDPTATPEPTPTPVPVAATPCVDGLAGEYSCDGIGLEAVVTIRDLGGLGGDEVNDMWGWTNPATGAEIAIVGTTSFTAFVDITEPAAPVVLGVLPHRRNLPSAVTDMKVFSDHVFIVGGAREFGMQVFDLTQLPATGLPSNILEPTAVYDEAGSIHNMAIDTGGGFAYLGGGDTCDGGFHMVDIRTPAEPAFVGCFDGAGAVHDAQCVVYEGPDQEHAGREICFSSNESNLSIVDVTDKDNPTVLSSSVYPGVSYTHQGWLTEDQAFFLLGDEFDEPSFDTNTQTIIFDMADLDAPVLTGVHDGATIAIDHNQFIAGNHSYQANYRAGLRILELTDLANGELTEVAFFDTYPANDGRDFSGAFSAYPFFESGVVTVTSIETGLFVLRPEPLG